MSRMAYTIPHRFTDAGVEVFPILFGNEGDNFDKMTPAANFNAEDGFEIAVYEDGSIYDHILTLHGIDPWRELPADIACC